jgi:hypothetical protein
VQAVTFGPYPLWQPTYYSIAAAAPGGSSLPAIMAHYRRLRSA